MSKFRYRSLLRFAPGFAVCQAANQPLTDKQRDAILQSIASIAKTGTAAAQCECTCQNFLDRDEAIFIRWRNLHRSYTAIQQSNLAASNTIQSPKINVEKRHIYTFSPASAVLREKINFATTYQNAESKTTRYALTPVYGQIKGE